MKTEQWKINKLTPYGGNPRNNDGAVDAVARSIQRYGFRQPIVVDKDGVIIVGHTRLKAAVKLGLETVPVHVATDLTEAKAREYRIADNSTNEIAEWDHEMLAAELREMPEFDAAEFGLEVPDVEGGSDGQVDDDGGIDPGSQFGVIILCETENKQREVYDEMVRLGYTVKVVCV